MGKNSYFWNRCNNYTNIHNIANKAKTQMQKYDIKPNITHTNVITDSRAYLVQYHGALCKLEYWCGAPSRIAAPAAACGAE